ncbi:spore coat protein [Bacillus cereus]|nr:spore coat protein [Bacillus sp. AFS023182]PGY04960.1 spore coat protein [Bacillus cereus]
MMPPQMPMSYQAQMMPPQMPMPYQPQMMPQQYPYYQMPYTQGMPIMPHQMPMQHTSMPYQPPIDNSNPQMMPAEEDCGCGGERNLYSPQPGVPNSPYYPTAQTAYAPQPGVMNYQQDPPEIFGEPLIEEGE